MQFFPPIKNTFYKYDKNPLANSFKPTTLNQNLLSNLNIQIS